MCVIGYLDIQCFIIKFEILQYNSHIEKIGNKLLMQAKPTSFSLSFMIPLFLIYALFLPICFCLGPHCSTSCYYPHSTVSNSFSAGCSASADPLACSSCDPQFSYLSSSQCLLNPDGIFNYTDVIPLTGYSNVTAGDVTQVTIDGTTNWYQMVNNAYIIAERYNNTANTAIYGMQCKIMFNVWGWSSSGFYPSINFAINRTYYSQNIQITPIMDPYYGGSGLSQWIYTTKFIKYTDPVIRYSIYRTDGTGTPSFCGCGIAFSDMRCMVAQCVVGCLSCTNLNDCSNCGTGYYLDPINHYCVTACPQGQYSIAGTNVCQLCDPNCYFCSTTATTCTKCQNHGPFFSFLQGTSCVLTCLNGYLPNYNTHICQCPAIGYYTNAGTCSTCDISCLSCTGAGNTNCIKCNLGYFLNFGTTTCTQTCPIQQYSYLIYDLALCYQCNNIQCYSCINSSTLCTSCNNMMPTKWLYNYTCLTLCPDGYQANNSTFICDQCMLGMYSFNNKCYSYCPTFYTPNDYIRACTLSGGYPISMDVNVIGASMMEFKIYLPLGLNVTQLAMLNSSWMNFITLSYTVNQNSALFTSTSRRLQQQQQYISQQQQQHNNNNIIIKQQQQYIQQQNNNIRLLQLQNSQSFGFSLPISNAIITNTSIILYSTSISADMMIDTYSFQVNFFSNLYSYAFPNTVNIMYQISVNNNTSTAPWIIRQYFDMSLRPFFLIGIFIAIAALIPILMRIKYIYRTLIQYLHSVQLVGLTFFALYPYSVQVNLYSFIKGYNYSNWQFMYNIASSLITPCLNCNNFSSFSFIIGDMNWVRLMGALLLCLAIMLLFCLFIYVFHCSRKYALFFITLVIDLVIVKCIHSWFASLVYSGLNMRYSMQDFDFYILAMHMFSYIVLLPLLYTRFKAQKQNKFPNLSLIFLTIFICLQVILSLAPTLICSLLMLLTFTQFVIQIGFNLTQQQKPPTQQQQKLLQQNEMQVSFYKLKYHYYLLRIIKPITALMVSCVVLLNQWIITVIVLTVVYVILLIFIILDAFFMYEFHKKLQQKAKIIPQTNININQTKEDMMNAKLQKQTIGLQIFDVQIADDDQIVDNKFRKKRKNMEIGTNGSQHKLKDTKDLSFIKNLD